MNERELFEQQKQKLEGVCRENNLTFAFNRFTYPISLVIRPTSGVDAQMTMMENADDGNYISPDAFIQFCFKEGVILRRYGGQFTITDTLQSKIERVFKKMCAFYLAHFFRYMSENKDQIRYSQPNVDDSPDDLPECEEIPDSLPTEEGGE